MATPHPSKSRHGKSSKKLKIWTAKELDAHVEEISGGSALKPSARALRYIARSGKKGRRPLSATRHNIPKQSIKEEAVKSARLPDPPALIARASSDEGGREGDADAAPESAFRTPVGMYTNIPGSTRVKKEEDEIAEMPKAPNTFLESLVERHFEKLLKLSKDIDEIIALERLVHATSCNLPSKQAKIASALFPLHDFLREKLPSSTDETIQPEQPQVKEEAERVSTSGRKNPLAVILEQEPTPAPPQKKIVYGGSTYPTRGARLQAKAQALVRSVRRSTSSTAAYEAPTLNNMRIKR